ncbi:GntR family transcriptional regulator [Paraburkholderia aromaticivorans]|uniref:GntR family transcriptional regulator n=1 Tax=Paraburkholderia aromaticivorans TaxID=2026199 RepID=UPI001455FF3F|nr:GntR family transcriptional regulator [Paraburkholderia aromaticivorans]
MKIWVPDLKAHRGPQYLAIADAIEQAVHGGALRTGDTLPPQRMLADLLGLHVNTINRGMRECARRGLTRGQTRRGTVIRHAPFARQSNSVGRCLVSTHQ